MATDEAATQRRAHRPGDPIDEETVRKQHEAIRRVVEELRAIHKDMLAARKGQTISAGEIDQLLDEVRGRGN